MQIYLQRKITVKGYSKLLGVDHKRIKARSKQINTSTYCKVVDNIRKLSGSYTSEYRLNKEPKGFIFREVLTDSGISGHHKTKRAAIIRALRYVTIHIDESFEHEHLPEFSKIQQQHYSREKCKHGEAFFETKYDARYCPTCDTILR